MKHTLYIWALAAASILLFSCVTKKDFHDIGGGAGGIGTGINADVTIRSDNDYVLVPEGYRITYTIDISTPEGKQMLRGISLKTAKTKAEIEATRKFNCDRLLEPRFTYDMSEDGKRIISITVDGRPAVYKPRSEQK